MNDTMYRAGGNNRFNLPIDVAEYRKQLLIEMRRCDKQYNIPVSQQAKHSIPNWLLILACLPPSDSDESLTAEEIVSIIDDFEYPITRESFNNAFWSMTSKNFNKNSQLSIIVRDTLNLVRGIKKIKVCENGVTMNSYSLGIGIAKLQELVDTNQFVTFSFNLNDNNAVKLLGRI